MVFAVLLIGALAAVLPDGAVAATAACTSIGNTASIDYQVGGVPQTTITTGPSATFTVGNKVDLTVTTQDGAIVTVVTGASGTGAPLTFRVTNAGNATQRYTLSALNYGPTETNPFGAGTDAFDATVGYDIYVDTGGGYGATSTISSLASGATATVQIRANIIPLAQPNGDIAVVALKAQTVNTDNSVVSVATGTGTVFDAGGNPVCAGIDVVLADIDSDAAQVNDGQYDGAYLSKDAYQVQAVVLSVLKSSVTITDAVFGTAKVPGAIIEYIVRVTRTGGGGSATGIVISDTVPGTTAPVANQYGGTGEVHRDTYDAATTTTTPTDLADPNAELTSWSTAAGATVTASCGGFVLDGAGDYCEIKFRVQIQ